jgi:hypothetical protein
MNRKALVLVEPVLDLVLVEPSTILRTRAAARILLVRAPFRRVTAVFDAP